MKEVLRRYREEFWNGFWELERDIENFCDKIIKLVIWVNYKGVEYFFWILEDDLYN